MARREKRENVWVTFILEISTAKILVPHLTVKYTRHKNFQVYGTSYELTHITNIIISLITHITNITDTCIQYHSWENFGKQNNNQFGEWKTFC